MGTLLYSHSVETYTYLTMLLFAYYASRSMLSSVSIILCNANEFITYGLSSCVMMTVTTC